MNNNWIFIQKILILLFTVILTHLNLDAQIDSSTNFKDLYESQSGEDFKPNPTSQDAKVPTTCNGEVIYFQDNDVNVDNAYTVGSAAIPAEAYDDFIVPINESWTISEIAFYLIYTNGVFDPTKDFTVQIINDNGGMPDINNVVCTSNVLGSTISATVVDMVSGFDLNETIMTLSMPCTLSPGTYWLCLGSNTGQSVLWEVLFSNPVIGNQSWLNVDGFGGLLPAENFFGDQPPTDHAFGFCSAIPCDPVVPTIIQNGATNKN